MESKTTTISFGTIPDAGSLKLIVTAIDSRGYETSVSEVLTVIDYKNIVIESYHIRRENNAESTIQLGFEGRISPVRVNEEDKNAFVRARYRYKLATKSSYGSYTVISGVYSDGSGYSFDNDEWITLPSDYAYNVQLEVSDKLSTYTVTLYVNKGQPLVSFRSGKVGVNTNDPQSALDVDGNIRMNGYGVMGYVKALYEGTSLDDIINPGIYFAGWVNSDLSQSKYPASNYGILEVLAYSTVFIVQRYTSNSGAMYVRVKLNGTWTAWKTITLS